MNRRSVPYNNAKVGKGFALPSLGENPPNLKFQTNKDYQMMTPITLKDKVLANLSQDGRDPKSPTLPNISHITKSVSSSRSECEGEESESDFSSSVESDDMTSPETSPMSKGHHSEVPTQDEAQIINIQECLSEPKSLITTAKSTLHSRDVKTAVTNYMGSPED